MPTTKNSTADEVLAALKQYPGSTAAELAEAAGLGRSTAGKCLVTLEQKGKAQRRPGGREGGRREPDRWALATATSKSEKSAGRLSRAASSARW